MQGKLEAAYRCLRQGILAQRYQPGQHLVEGRLCAELGLSRASLRMVLVRLAQDGMVVLEPNRGARVRVCSPAEVVDAYEAREVLEGFAAWLAARQAQPELLACMAAANDAMAAADEAGDAAEFLAGSNRFHDVILEAAGQPVLTAFLESIRYPMRAYRFSRSSDAQRRRQTMAEHEAILACIRAGDSAGAEDVMRHHTARRDARAWFGLAEKTPPACQQATSEPAIASKFEQACEQLRQRILSGQYQPGEHLTEGRLAEDLRVSRPTLHAVLARLQQENLLVAGQHLGVRVRTFSAMDVHAIWQARSIVEARCAGLAAERAAAGDLEQLEALTAGMAGAHRQADRLGYAALSREFHSAVVEAARQPVLAKFLQAIRYPSIVVQATHGGDPAVRGASLAEHQAILACIRIHDPAGAEEVMRKHMASAEPALPPAR